MIYFIKSLGLGAIKIGYTTDAITLETRIRNLQANIPDKLELVAVIGIGTREYERQLHKRFNYLKIRSE